MNFNSSSEFQIRADSWNSSQNADLVYFNVDVKELFGITLDYPGLKGALNAALEAGRAVTPIDTGLLRRSMTMRQLNDHAVVVFYDPKKIVGAIRKGVKVKDYYPKFLEDHAKTFNWLAIVIKHFYDELFARVKLLKKKEPKPVPNPEDKPTEVIPVSIPENSTIHKKSTNNSLIDMTVGLLFLQSLNRQYQEKKKQAKLLQEEQKQKQLNQLVAAQALSKLRKAQHMEE